jgi:thioredoxin 1
MVVHRILSAALFVTSLGLAAAHAATVEPYQQADFIAAQQADKPILIFVDAQWCPVCAKERPILSSLYDTAAFKDLQVFTIDFDTSKPLLHSLNVQLQSTLIIYHGKKETGRATGLTDPEAIRMLLEASKA